MNTYKVYECENGFMTYSATKALGWHRDGADVIVSTYAYDDNKDVLLSETVVHGAKPVERNADDENRQHCKRIAKEVEAYANGEICKCPECGEEIRLPDDVGDKYRCPHCHEVNDVDDLEQLGVWDYMSDILDIEYRCSSDKEYRSCRICVAWGGPNIYIDTASAMVKLYWWNEYAEFPLSYEARDAVDEWAEEYWNM